MGFVPCLPLSRTRDEFRGISHIESLWEFSPNSQPALVEGGAIIPALPNVVIATALRRPLPSAFVLAVDLSEAGLRHGREHRLRPAATDTYAQDKRGLAYALGKGETASKLNVPGDGGRRHACDADHRMGKAA